MVFVISVVSVIAANPALISLFLGKRKAYTALLQYRTFSFAEKMGSQRKDFGGIYIYGFLVFVSTNDLESSSLRPEKFPKDFHSVVVYAFFFSVACSRLSCLRHFRDSRRFCERRPACKP